MLTAIKRRKIAENCTHDTITTTSSYGIQRDVCIACGRVTVSHLYDFIEESRKQREEVTTQAS